MWKTIGHGWAVEALQKAVEREQVAQANLFTGPKHIGKTHLALELAAALVCEDEDRPCGVCRSCQLVQRNAHPDVSLVEPDGGRIKIDQVRELQHELALSPYEAAWRVCVIADFETATVQASNALLKTLEEPPESAVLIVTATDAGLLLPTIVSRCRVMSLRNVPLGEIREALVKTYALQNEEAELLARLSGGRVGWALRAAQDDQVLAERREDIETLLGLLDGTQAARIRAAEKLYRRDDLPELARLWQTWWRDVLLVQTHCMDMIVNLDFVGPLQRLAQRFSVAQARRAVRGTEQLLDQLGHSVNTRLALEVLFLSW